MIFLLFVSLSLAEPPATLDDLSWMTGVWGGTRHGVEMEEVWLEPRGGVMLGLHRDVSGSEKAFYEYLRIEQTDEGIVYQASPMGRPPTPFRLIESAKRKAVFENPEHDFPQRIIYWMDDEGALNARTEGKENGVPRALEFRWEPKTGR